MQLSWYNSNHNDNDSNNAVINHKKNFLDEVNYFYSFLQDFEISKKVMVRIATFDVYIEGDMGFICNCSYRGANNESSDVASGVGYSKNWVKL